MTRARNAAALGRDTEGAGTIKACGPLTTLQVRAPYVPARAALAQVAGVFVVVVTIEEESYRRRVYLTLKAAERASRQAAERGHTATVVLARLEPVRADG